MKKIINACVIEPAFIGSLSGFVVFTICLPFAIYGGGIKLAITCSAGIAVAIYWCVFIYNVGEKRYK